MLFNYCPSHCQKAGRQKNGTQKWYCNSCRRYQQREYQYQAYKVDVDAAIVNLLKEGCGIRSISRLLSISTNTATKRILQTANKVERPLLIFGKEYEMDELCTYVGRKKRKVWVAYAIRKDTREVVDFRVGSRTNKTLKTVITTLELSAAKTIHTGRFTYEEEYQ